MKPDAQAVTLCSLGAGSDAADKGACAYRRRLVVFCYASGSAVAFVASLCLSPSTIVNLVAKVRSWRDVVPKGGVAACSDVSERDEDEDADATEDEDSALEKLLGPNNPSPEEVAGRAVEGPISFHVHMSLLGVALAAVTSGAVLSLADPAPVANVIAKLDSWRSVAQQDEAVALAVAVCVMLGVAAWCSDVFERDEDVDADATEERHGAQEKPPGSAKNTSPVEVAGRAVEGPVSFHGHISLLFGAVAIANAGAALSFGGPAPAAKLVAQLEP